MTLELENFDALDWVNDDQGLANLLNDALESGDEPYIAATVSDIERAKGLVADERLSTMARAVRAARSVGVQLATIPRAA